MSVNLAGIALAECALAPATDSYVAFYQGQSRIRSDFSREVAGSAAVLAQQAGLEFGLYYEQAYPFTVMLFALWHAGKSVWIAANNKPATAEKLLQQGCLLLGDWPVGMATALPAAEGTMALSALDGQQTQLNIFTSGSTGQPQAIQKQLWQIQNEVDLLERQWGGQLVGTQVLATVSHQHIYGLIFRILWPLASGRCFHSQLYLSPESMLKAAAGQPAYWVASPAQLKRLDELSPWTEIKTLAAIFSSGGALDSNIAEYISAHSGQQPIDIYGSSETGGIAWRQPALDSRWRPFPGVGFSFTDDQKYQLHSPYLPAGQSVVMQDRLDLYADGCFSLLGRMDRIVKIEEKRLSLDELEQCLQTSALVQQAHCLAWGDKRLRIAAVVILSAPGLDFLKQQGRNALAKQLKSHLLASFEAVVLPKKWLFTNLVPLSTQGKIDQQKIGHLLALDKQLFPQLQFFNQQDDGIELSLIIQADLAYFSGHFPGQPILPGVTQLAWVEKYGKLFFPITQPFRCMEVIKFKKIIRPHDKLTLQMHWNADHGKLYFDFSSSVGSHSSGRLLYGEQA